MQEAAAEGAPYEKPTDKGSEREQSDIVGNIAHVNPSLRPAKQLQLLVNVARIGEARRLGKLLISPSPVSAAQLLQFTQATNQIDDKSRIWLVEFTTKQAKTEASETVVVAVLAQ